MNENHYQEQNPSLVYDDEVLGRAIADAGRWAYGTVFVELWVWNDDHTVLYRPTSGWWVDPSFHRTSVCAKAAATAAAAEVTGSINALPPTTATATKGTGVVALNHHHVHKMTLKKQDSCPICRLTDATRSDFVPPVPLAAGVGIPGVLWSEAMGRGHRRSWRGGGGSGSHNNSNNRQQHFNRRGSTTVVNPASQIIFPETTAPSATDSPTVTAPVSKKQLVAWREIKAIANDPDQPWNPRLQLLATMGLGWVAAVDFDKLDSPHHCGIVVYMARDGVDLLRLQSPSNEAYLVAASDLIAAAFALRSPRRCVVQERRMELTLVLRRVRDRILYLHRMGIRLDELLPQPQDTTCTNIVELHKLEAQSMVKYICTGYYMKLGRQRLVTVLLKAIGGGVQPPPATGWQESFLTFIGCFVTLLLLTRLDLNVIERFGTGYAKPLAPFGALMTLLYGLTAAPASQPRNILLGQCISMTIAMLIGTYTHHWSNWFRQSLATSLAIATMVKLGVTHPPAGASALLFATGKYGWGNMLFAILGNVLAIVCATVINNCSNARQFPSYWGIGYIDRAVQRIHASKTTEDKAAIKLVPKPAPTVSTPTAVEISQASRSCDMNDDMEEVYC